MRCDPIQKKGMPSFSVLALFGVSPNVDSTCLWGFGCIFRNEAQTFSFLYSQQEATSCFGSALVAGARSRVPPCRRSTSLSMARSLKPRRVEVRGAESLRR